MTWAGNVETMGDEKLAMRTDVQKVKGKGRREDRTCDGMMALGGIWKIKRTIKNKNKRLKELDTCRERSEKKGRKEEKRRKMKP